MKKLFLLVLFSIALSASSPAQSPVYQLRIYKIHPGNETHFHEHFRDHCMPIMKRYGFDIVFTAQSGPDGQAEFVYMLRWKDRTKQASAWKDFLADPEWIAIKKATTAKYSDLVDVVEDRPLEMLPYTPASSEVP